MDGRSISSRYDFSESDSESIHSGQGRTARTVSFARRYVSTVSLFSLRKRDSKRERGHEAQSPASKPVRREDGGGAELRPRTSYLFSLGKEHSGLVEIIPETSITAPSDSDSDPDAKYDSRVEVISATPVRGNSPDSTTAAEGILFQQWRHSALLPLPETHMAFRPGTCASSIYSQEVRGSAESVDDCASSIYSQESRETVRTRTLIPGQLHMTTRSLVSLAKRYSSPDDASIYSRYECGAVAGVPSEEEPPLPNDDDVSVYSRDDRANPEPWRPIMRAGTMGSTQSLPLPSRDGWHTKPLPALPIEREPGTWLLPPTRDGQSRETSKIWWKRESTLLPSPENVVDRSRSATIASESPVSPVSPCSEEPSLRRRPSSWSWLSIDTTLGDRPSRRTSRASSIGSVRSLAEPSILRGQRYLRSLSMRSSTRSEPVPHAEVASQAETVQCPATPPPRYSKIYMLEQRLAAESRLASASSISVRMLPGEGRRAARQDPLQLPPLQLPELPDEQRVFFYARCGHLETELGLFLGAGPEIPGWCPLCSKGRSRKRKVVRRELKSMLKSIAE